MHTDTNTTTFPLRERRHRAKLSQQQLAEAAHCSIAYIQTLERGFMPSTSDVLPRVEAVLANAELERELCAA
jgi:transcriptional regulator with XRE-family HTH domain